MAAPLKTLCLIVSALACTSTACDRFGPTSYDPSDHPDRNPTHPAPPATPAESDEAEREADAEAALNLARIRDGAVSYFSLEFVTMTGEIIPAQFPASAIETPARAAIAAACDGSEGFIDPDVHRWHDVPTWEGLQFTVNQPHRLTYAFTSQGRTNEATFTASAFGDIDCNGNTTEWQIHGRVVEREVLSDRVRRVDE